MDRLIDSFINSLNRRETTKDTYRKALREFAKWVGNGKPENLTSDDIRRYKDYLAAKELSSTSLSAYLTAVRRLYEYMVSTGKVPENPAKKIKGGKRPSRHLTEPVRPSEMRKLLESIDIPNPVGLRDKAILSLMANCGLSEIEIVRADIGDIKTRNKNRVIYVQGKNKDVKDEYVLLFPQALASLEAYLETRPERENNEPLFWGIGNRARGARITTRAIRERVSHYLNKSGIKRAGITPYSLRHTAALLAIQNGATVSEVKRMLRHKTTDSTLVYFEEAKERGIL